MSNRTVGVHFDGDLRSVLIAQAAEDIATHGIEGFSLRDLARQVGVSHAAPAHHFGDRTGLLTAIATVGFERFAGYLADALATIATDEPDELFPALAAAYVTFADQERGFFDVMFQPGLLRSDDVRFAAAGAAAFEALRGAIAACQRRGWRAGSDPQRVAAAAWAFAHGLAMLHRQGSLQRHFGTGSPSDVAALAAELV